MSVPVYIYLPALVSHSHISVRLKHSGNILQMSEHVLTTTITLKAAGQFNDRLKIAYFFYRSIKCLKCSK